MMYNLHISPLKWLLIICLASSKLSQAIGIAVLSSIIYHTRLLCFALLNSFILKSPFRFRFALSSSVSDSYRQTERVTRLVNVFAVCNSPIVRLKTFAFTGVFEAISANPKFVFCCFVDDFVFVHCNISFVFHWVSLLLISTGLLPVDPRVGSGSRLKPSSHFRTIVLYADFAFSCSAVSVDIAKAVYELFKLSF